jgi:hypothetical protein
MIEIYVKKHLVSDSNCNNEFIIPLQIYKEIMLG